MPKEYRFNTLAIHAGQKPDPTTGAVSVPIYQTTSYVFESPEQAANLFSLKEEGYIYTRMSNPTTAVFEDRMAALENGVGALAVSSGEAAIMLAVLNITQAGQEIVSAANIYGGTHTLLGSTLAKLGIKTFFVDATDPQNFARAATEKTRAFFIETMGNPTIEVPDLAAIAEIAHQKGVPLIVDNTFATPYHCRPIEYGADIVVHSATKFIGGHGTAIGGIIVDSGNFPWEESGRYPELSLPDPSYHGASYTASFGSKAYIVKARAQLLRDMGSTLSPFNSFLFLQGLETLPLRMRQHSENALAVANFLNEHEKVSWVNYPGLEGNPYRKNAQRFLEKGFGAILTFGLKGGFEAAKRFISNLELFYHLANVGDARSLVIHPASTTHSQLSEREQRESGITPEMVRLSVGLEDIEDIIADLEKGLSAA